MAVKINCNNNWSKYPKQIRNTIDFIPTGKIKTQLRYSNFTTDIHNDTITETKQYKQAIQKQICTLLRQKKYKKDSEKLSQEQKQKTPDQFYLANQAQKLEEHFGLKTAQVGQIKNNLRKTKHSEISKDLKICQGNKNFSKRQFTNLQKNETNSKLFHVSNVSLDKIYYKRRILEPQIIPITTFTASNPVQKQICLKQINFAKLLQNIKTPINSQNHYSSINLVHSPIFAAQRNTIWVTNIKNIRADINRSIKKNKTCQILVSRISCKNIGTAIKGMEKRKHLNANYDDAGGQKRKLKKKKLTPSIRKFNQNYQNLQSSPKPWSTDELKTVEFQQILI